MSSAQERVLSARDAARIIYNTTDPSEEQVNKVRAKLARRQLRASGKGHWTTTQQAVADYLAMQAIGRAGTPEGVASMRPSGDHQRLSGYCRQLVKDYFFALALRRRAAHRSRSFHQATIIGQVLLLLVGMLLVFQSYKAMVRVTNTPEQRAVLAWLESNVERYQAVEWLPVAQIADGTLVPVHYTYFQNAKGIRTRRAFIVRDGKVTDCDADDK